MRLTTSVAVLLLLVLSVAAQQPTARSVRGNIAPGGTIEFKQLTIAVLVITMDPIVATPHASAKIRLEEGGATEEVTVRQGESLNWHGYHVAIAAVHKPGNPGGGRVELEVATVASLPQCVGKAIGEDRPWPCR